MGEEGILSPDVRVELVDGEIRRTPPIGPPHASIVDRITGVLSIKLAGMAILRVQNPIGLDDNNEPRPDATVLRLRDDYYGRSHPAPADVLLVIEVADSSLLYDRNQKMPRYGRAGIPEAWLIDVEAETITVFTGPNDLGYAKQRTMKRGSEILSVGVRGLRVRVDEILG